MRPPFVPSHYTSSRTVRLVTWKHPRAPAEPCESIVDDIVSSVERPLDFRIHCDLHLVIYASQHEAQIALDRTVPASMLLAPFQTAASSVIAVQSSTADPLNADLERMRRHLAHELVHVAVALRTGSEKRLGDENRLMRVKPWVNEGFACVVAALTSDRIDLLDRALVRAAAATVPDLDDALNGLDDVHRSAAFAVATARVWRAVLAHGLGHVFAALSQPELWNTDDVAR